MRADAGDLAVLDDAQVIVNHVHHVQQLALVFVDALDLHVEDGVGIDHDSGLVADGAGQLQLVLALDLLERGAKFRIFGPRLQVAQTAQVGDPLLLVEGVADQVGQPGIGLHQPAPRSHAVGLVIEFLRPHLGELGNQRFHQQVAVQLRRRR